MNSNNTLNAYDYDFSHLLISHRLSCELVSGILKKYGISLKEDDSYLNEYNDLNFIAFTIDLDVFKDYLDPSFQKFLNEQDFLVPILSYNPVTNYFDNRFSNHFPEELLLDILENFLGVINHELGI